MRILIITEFFPPELRSAAHLLHDLAREFRRRDHDVAVITRIPRHYMAEADRSRIRAGWGDVDGVPTFRTRAGHLGSRRPVFRAIEHVLLGWRFRSACRAWPRADVVLVYSPPLPLAMTADGYRRRFGAPFVLNVQDLYPQTAIDLGLLKNRVAIRMAERMEHRAYARAACIVVHSPGNLEFLVGRKGVAPEKVRVIYNWVNTSEVRPMPRANGFRAEHGLADKFVVSYAGLMGYAQDLSTIIECATLLRTDPEMKFLLVGEGVLESRWKQMVAERGLGNVRFLPMQPRERYPQLLAASDLCLIPLDAALRTPVVPGKLQSIMASGRPAVTIMAPEGDTPKLIRQSGGGVSISPGDARGLAEVVRQLKANSALGEEMGRRGRVFAEAHFSLSRCADAYEETFQTVIAHRGLDDLTALGRTTSS